MKRSHKEWHGCMTEEKKEREDRNEFAFDDPSGVAADFARARDADAKDGGSRFGETRGIS